MLVVSRPLAEPDAIVSLASHEWERLPETARLGGRYPAARILLTLPAPVSEFNCHDCGGRADRLQRMGVERSRIDILPLIDSGTYGEARACLAFATQMRIHRLLIVTSPYHTRRALAIFRKVFADTAVEVGIQPASVTSQADPNRWWRTPYDRWYVRYEWLAVVFYTFRYGITPL